MGNRVETDGSIGHFARDAALAFLLFLAGIGAAGFLAVLLQTLLPPSVAYALAFGVGLIPFFVFAKWRNAELPYDGWDLAILIGAVVGLAMLFHWLPALEANRPARLGVSAAYFTIVFPLFLWRANQRKQRNAAA